MTTIGYIEINLFALVILALIYINIRRRVYQHMIEQRLYLALLCLNAAGLLLDSAGWLLNGRHGTFVGGVILIVDMAYVFITPAPCLLWSFYADYQVFHDAKRLKKMIVPFLLPFLVSTVAAAVSPFNGALFYIDGANFYHRGNWFIILTLVCYTYLIYTLIFILRYRKRLSKEYFIPILAFFLPPFVSGMIQAACYGVSLIWASMTVSVLIVFINLQNSQLFTDYLTGLFNRRQLDFYLQERIKSDEKNTRFAGIMIDLDTFKAINDTWGHSAGDKALMDTAKILNGGFGKNDLICRYGGDEFVVIAEIDKETGPVELIARIRKSADAFELKHSRPYKVRYSIGCDIYDSASGMDAQQFISHIDRLMYEDKRRCRPE